MVHFLLAHASSAGLDRGDSFQGRVLSYVLFGNFGNGVNFFQYERSSSSLFWCQKFNQLFIVFRNLCFCGELLLSQFKTLLVFIISHFLKVDILKNRVNDWLGFHWSDHLGLSGSHHSLNNDVVAVNTDVLEERVRDECVSGELLQEVNLLRLRRFLETILI